MQFVALDTETTGMDPRRDRIIELYMRKVSWPNLGPLDSVHLLVNPGVPIPLESTALHGFSETAIRNRLRFSEYAPDVQAYLDDAVIIAYNGLRFDLPLLHHELLRAGCRGLPPDTPVIDPYRIFLTDLPRSLTGALQYYVGENHDHAHSATEDVTAMIKVLSTQLLTREPAELLAEALRPDEIRLDSEGCFFQDRVRVTRFAFGRYRGQPIHDHIGYLHWMLSSDFSVETKRVIRNFLEGRGNGDVCPSANQA